MTNTFHSKVAVLDSDQLSGHLCGGALVSNLHVVTAAHCTVETASEGLWVAVGYTDLSSKQENRFIIPVKEVRNHPRYRYLKWNEPKTVVIMTFLEEPRINMPTTSPCWFWLKKWTSTLFLTSSLFVFLLTKDPVLKRDGKFSQGKIISYFTNNT